jgi:hypothetical protein
VGGGDRHGVTPNSLVNLTWAADFAEFVHEVRVERATYCVVFPEYTQPFVTRLLQTADDVLRPERRQGRAPRTWADRIFTCDERGEHSVSSRWTRAPRWLEAAVTVTRLLGTSGLSGLLGSARSDGHDLLAADCRAAFDAIPRLAPDSIAAA